jgi:hypothetical protein
VLIWFSSVDEELAADDEAPPPPFPAAALTVLDGDDVELLALAPDDATADPLVVELALLPVVEPEAA